MIERDDSDDVVVLRMAHGKANALDYELCKALIDSFDALREDDTRPVVITGRDGMFSAGVDLFRVVNEGRAYLNAFLPALLELFARMFDFPRPLVAAVNGHAIAGGCVMACACDYRVAAEGSGRIGMPELRVGVPFPTIALEILRFRLGDAHLEAAVYSGETCSVDEALRLGFVDEIVDENKLLARALHRARHFAAVPARSYALTKRALRDPVRSRIAARGPENDAAVNAAWAAPETLDNISAYLERTFGKKA